MGKATPIFDCTTIFVAKYKTMCFEHMNRQKDCTFKRNLHSNVCLTKVFKPTAGIPDSICYVSAECAGAEKMKEKTCKSDVDTLLTDMPILDRALLAYQNNVEQSIMTKYAGLLIWKNPSDVSSMQKDIYMMSPVRRFIYKTGDNPVDTTHAQDDRWEFKDGQLWIHRYNPYNPDTPGDWDVFCQEGCQ